MRKTGCPIGILLADASQYLGGESVCWMLSGGLKRRKNFRMVSFLFYLCGLSEELYKRVIYTFVFLFYRRTTHYFENFHLFLSVNLGILFFKA